MSLPLNMSTYPSNAIGHADVGHFEYFHVGIRLERVEQILQDVRVHLAEIVDIDPGEVFLVRFRLLDAIFHVGGVVRLGGDDLQRFTLGRR